MLAFKIELIVTKAALGIMRVAVLREAEYLEWLELLSEPLDELPEMQDLIGFWW